MEDVCKRAVSSESKRVLCRLLSRGTQEQFSGTLVWAARFDGFCHGIARAHSSLVKPKV